MTEHPILFNAEMVRAVLDGRKTQTRRVMKPQPSNFPKEINPYNGDYEHFTGWDGLKMCNGETGNIKNTCHWSCPYGVPGDRLWVRETTAEDVIGSQSHTRYVADNHGRAIEWQHARPVCPSIFMRREASRILLEVTEVRVERVQDISEYDCREEGIQLEQCPACGYTSKDASIHLDHALCKGAGFPNDREVYKNLWDSINGEKPGRSWNANPWVWAVNFKVVK